MAARIKEMNVIVIKLKTSLAYGDGKFNSLLSSSLLSSQFNYVYIRVFISFLIERITKIQKVDRSFKNRRYSEKKRHIKRYNFSFA